MKSKDKRSLSKDERLEELGKALKDAQFMLLDQANRIQKLMERPDDPEVQLAEAREQLTIVQAERDQLQKQLLALERMQTETVTLPDGAAPGSKPDADLPSIEQLMGGSPAADSVDEPTAPRRRINGGPSAEVPESDVDEMISPAVIVPEAFRGEAGEQDVEVDRPTTRMLVCTDPERALKVVLREGTMTLGRSESANIRVDEPYVSRIHARIICRPHETLIIDAGSRNGFKVNSVAVQRHPLVHGDVIALGTWRFTFLDTAAQS